MVQLEQIFFMTEFKNKEQNRSTRVEAISLLTMCIKFCLNVGELLLCRCQECPGLDPEFGIKMMEIKVAEINAPLKLGMRKLLTKINAT